MSPTGTTNESSRQDSRIDVSQNKTRPQRDIAVNGKEPEKPSTLSTRYKSLMSVPDGILLRLDSLLAPAADLSAVLSTFSYVLGILAFFHVKARAKWHKLHHHHSPHQDHHLDQHHGNHLDHHEGHHLDNHLEHHLDHHLDHHHAHSELHHRFHPKSSSAGTLASLFWRARLTLRLFGLLRIYARARQLLRGRRTRGQDQDQILFATDLLQCVLYGASQLLENVAFLTDSRILSRRLTARWTKAHGGRTGGIYTLAYRAWFLGVSCEFVRVFRNVQLMSQKGQQQQSSSTPPEEELKTEVKDKWWHPQLLVQLLWFPIGWQVSAWTEEGFPGFNTTLHSAASVLSDVEKTGSLWKSTEAVD